MLRGKDAIPTESNGALKNTLYTELQPLSVPTIICTKDASYILSFSQFIKQSPCQFRKDTTNFQA